MDTVSLTIPGAFFRSGYAVYVVEIVHSVKGNTYYYLGQTGDAVHPIARPPFYRMSGHFEYGAQSTQNQIFKGLCVKLGIEKEDQLIKREKVEAFLAEAEIRYHVFRLHDFSYRNVNKAEHKKRRHNTLVVETAMLQRFNRRYDDALLNSKLTSLQREPSESERAQIDSVIEKLNEIGIEI